MNGVQQMLQTHPATAQYAAMNALANCISACYECSQTCTSCADACLAEKDRDQLMRCIRLNQDCADVCLTTGRILSRHMEPEKALLRRQVEVCAIACRLCAEECEKHAHHHEHCRVCAEACRGCEETCKRLLESMPA